MGMVGLRDLFVVAPASTFHHHHEQPHYSDHHPPHHSINSSSNPATALGVGIVPLLTATPCLDTETMMSNRNRGSSGGIQGIQFWQDQQPHHYLKNHSVNVCHENYVQSGGSGDGDGITVSGTNSGGTTTCQDCGNQAKKDCCNRRCRTCCKSRGFDCPTHVRSTWVPAARRRERQLMQSVTGGGGCSTASTSGAKKPKLISSHTTTNSRTSTSNTTPPRSFDTSSSHQDGGIKEPLPGQIRAPAVFKCVKVTAVEDGEDEYAYQAVVKIGGHVFKGFLYDQGVENRDLFPNLSELHLGGGSGGNGNGGGGSGRNGVSTSSPLMDPSDIYGGGLLGGSTYGNSIN
ncbi:putative transcription factor STY-LRP1 family [Lupinus albus]|uniref:Putative transcription factor STY-LRP1 family n=1 Tax=Lupinus albus TaxID=3870 RepID=A0A6A4QPH0_LUPAL|nr:putative transcription factor STY-LRP1 family [Lupinus albus]